MTDAMRERGKTVFISAIRQDVLGWRVLQREKDGYRSKLLTDDELQEPSNRVKDAEIHLRQFLDISSKVTTTTTPPPSPPS